MHAHTSIYPCTLNSRFGDRAESLYDELVESSAETVEAAMQWIKPSLDHTPRGDEAPLTRGVSMCSKIRALDEAVATALAQERVCLHLKLVHFHSLFFFLLCLSLSLSLSLTPSLSLSLSLSLFLSLSLSLSPRCSVFTCCFMETS